MAGEKEVLEHYKMHCTIALKFLSFDLNDDKAYHSEHQRQRGLGVNPWILKYACGREAGTEGGRRG